MTIMEVCGTHTAVIAKSGLKSLLPPDTRLVSGPGCPVCVTPEGFIDKLITISETERVLCFGDLFRVPGNAGNLAQAKARGGKISLVYSPFDALKYGEPVTLAAVGFETTAPLYAALLERVTEQRRDNIKLLCALKTMPEIVKSTARSGEVGAFIAPGNVSVITGYKIWEDVGKPCAVAGFSAKSVLAAVEALREGRSGNFYGSAVTERGNERALELINKYFEPCAAVWRGMGEFGNSGLRLRAEFARYGAGDYDTAEGQTDCRCGGVLLGRVPPEECPLFGSACTPENPAGACMVSSEGSCRTAYEC